MSADSTTPESPAGWPRPVVLFIISSSSVVTVRQFLIVPIVRSLESKYSSFPSRLTGRRLLFLSSSLNSCSFIPVSSQRGEFSFPTGGILQFPVTPRLETHAGAVRRLSRSGSLADTGGRPLRGVRERRTVVCFVPGTAGRYGHSEERPVWHTRYLLRFSGKYRKCITLKSSGLGSLSSSDG